MSDETTGDTTRTDGRATADASSAAAPQDAARPVGFCQDCGRGLSPETQRVVGTGVFCEPCLETRLRAGAWGAAQTATGAQSYGAAQNYGPAQSYGSSQTYSGAQPGAYGPVTTPPLASVPDEPSPVLAAVLGLIPGVGAMYNGQFAKGVVHLVIFAILVSLADNVNGIFGLFVAGWVFYQAFEAYHTAVARRDGLPLPNAFGFNDIGERMGFGRTWGVPSSAAPGQPPATPPPPGPTTGWAGTASVPTPPPPAAQVPPTAPQGMNTPPPTAGPDWIGYVPPTAFAGATQPYASAPPVAPTPSAVPTAQHTTSPWGHAPYAPYAETYTGTGPWPAAPNVPLPPLVPPRRFPVGALWLIGLGLLILLANLLPDWRISSRWWPPVLFAGLAVWLFTRRLYSGARLACIIRWPAILMVLAIIFALHAAYFVVSFGMTCAVLLIVFGALLLVERTLGASPAYVPPDPPYSASQPYAAQPYGAAQPYDAAPDPARASFTAPGPAASEPVADATKGGQ